MVFDYPSTFTAKHAPWGYIRYATYKDWLRDEFAFRCVYCLTREKWCPTGHRDFAVEHILPKVSNIKKATVYENLAYACHLCNSIKGTKILPNPRTNPFGRHLFVNPDGTITGITGPGKKLILKLLLDDPERDALRKRYIDIYNAFQNPAINGNQFIIDLYNDLFGYPVSLPDLKGKKPKRNVNKISTNRCFFQRYGHCWPRPVYF